MLVLHNIQALADHIQIPESFCTATRIIFTWKSLKLTFQKTTAVNLLKDCDIKMSHHSNALNDLQCHRLSP